MQETIVWQGDHVRAEFTSLDPARVDPTPVDPASVDPASVDPAAGTAPDTNLRAWCSVPCTGGRPGRPASFAARYDRAMGGLPQRAGVCLEYLPSAPDRLEICIPADVAGRDHWPLDTGAFSPTPADAEFDAAIMAGLLHPWTPPGRVTIRAICHHRERSSWVAFHDLARLSAVWLSHGGVMTPACAAALERAVP